MLRPFIRGLVLPLVLALVSGVAAWLLLEQHIAQRVARLEPVAVETRDVQQVVVPGQTLEPGTPLTANLLMLRELDARSLPADALTATSIEDYLGRELRYPVPSGRPLQRLHLRAPGPASFVQRLARGARPVTMRYDSQEQHAGLVQLGDVLDLYIPVRGALELLLTGVQVIATDDQWKLAAQDDPFGNSGYQTLTLAVPEEKVAKVRQYIQRGELVTLLRAPEDKPRLTRLAGVREVEYILPQQGQFEPEVLWP